MELLVSGCHGSSLQKFSQAHTDLGFSQSLMGAASKPGSFTSQGGQLSFPIIPLSCMLIAIKIVLGGEDKGKFPLSYLLY